MAAKLIDGSALAAQVRREVAERIAQLKQQGQAVQLTAILVGSSPAAEVYAENQARSTGDIGIDYRLLKLPADSSMQQVRTTIEKLNHDATVTGIMLHLPLPSQLDAPVLQHAIDPLKDVEGVSPANIGYVVYGHTLIAPCTALAVIELIKSTGQDLRGVEAVVVGASEIAGKPIALLLTEQMATVTLCHIATHDLSSHTRRGQVLVVAVGKPGLIGPDQVQEGAIVIDVGINRIKLADGSKKTVGDVQFDAVAQKAGYLTPVPGGVGPMTVAMLLKNTLRAAELVRGKMGSS